MTRICVCVVGAAVAIQATVAFQDGRRPPLKPRVPCPPAEQTFGEVSRSGQEGVGKKEVAHTGPGEGIAKAKRADKAGSRPSRPPRPRRGRHSRRALPTSPGRPNFLLLSALTSCPCPARSRSASGSKPPTEGPSSRPVVPQGACSGAQWAHVPDQAAESGREF